MKTKLVLSVLLAATLLVLFGCKKEPVQTPPQPTTYTLQADRTEVGINEIVNFTVVTNTGEDVTDQFQMCSDTNCYGSYAISWSAPGTYTVHATMRADETVTCENTITVTVSGSIYTLSADKDEIYVLDTVTFTVTEITDGEEQEAPAGFRIGEQGGERYTSGLTYTFTEAGVYTIDAIRYNYRGEEIARTSNTVTIIVREKEIAGYEDNFFRRSLFAEGTGTKCTSCPYMVEALEYVTTYLQPDRLIPVAYHEVDALDVDFYQPFYDLPRAMRANTDLYFNNYPWYIIDWNATYASDGDARQTEAKAEEISHSVNASQASLSKSKVPGLAIATTLSGRQLDMTIKATVREEGEYLLGAVLVEDNKLAEQMGAGTTNEMVHMNIAQMAITTETGTNPYLHDEDKTDYFDPYGSLSLDRMGTLAAEQEWSRDYSITIPDRVVVENSRVVVYIIKMDASIKPLGFFCANATTVKAGESLDYEYEPIYEE